MKLVWSPETASEAYIDTVKSCKSFKESSIAELLSTMAAGWNAKLIVQAWFHGAPIVTSIGLAIAARHTRGRYVCIVPDEQSRQKYMNAMKEHDEVASPPEVVVGEAEVAMAGLVGVNFLVVDCEGGDFDRVLRFAKLDQGGAVLACNNSNTRDGNAVSGFRWHGMLERGARVVRTVFLPVEKGLDIAHVGSTTIGGSGSGSGSGRKAPRSRWIRHIDARSGEEHVFQR